MNLECSISPGLSRSSCALVSLLVLVLLTGPSTAARATESGSQDAAKPKQELIYKLSQRFPKEEITAIFADKRLELDRSVIPPKKYRPAFAYYKTVLAPRSVRDGRDYVDRYTSALSDAQQRYGVPREVIVGILRIETNLGRNLGRRRVFNSLYSLYVLVPRRKNFALRELEAFLSICRKNHWDPYDIVGSPMGAFGFPQFLPSSYLSYAIDADRDGRADLFSSTDAIYSTAAYLHGFGWGRSRKSQFRAIYAYNHERAYVKTVLAYADRLKGPGPAPLPDGKIGGLHQAVGIEP